MLVICYCYIVFLCRDVLQDKVLQLEHNRKQMQKSHATMTEWTENINNIDVTQEINSEHYGAKESPPKSKNVIMNHIKHCRGPSKFVLF